MARSVCYGYSITKENWSRILFECPHITNAWKSNISRDYTIMKARMKPIGQNDDLQVDELREVLEDKITSMMVSKLQNSKKVKVVTQHSNKKEDNIATIKNLAGNSNSMLIDLNFGDRDVHSNLVNNLIKTTKHLDSKHNVLDNYLINLLKIVDIGNKKNIKLNKKMINATKLLKNLKK